MKYMINSINAFPVFLAGNLYTNYASLKEKYNLHFQKLYGVNEKAISDDLDVYFGNCIIYYIYIYYIIL